MDVGTSGPMSWSRVSYLHPIRSADDAASLLHVPDALLLFTSRRQPYACASIRLCSAYLCVCLRDGAASSIRVVSILVCVSIFVCLRSL